MFLESITIKDVAKLCGVGVTTVSRAINNHPDINEETKKRVLSIVEQYGYVPNNSARNLKRSETKNIAILVKGITNPFFSNMIKVFEQEIQTKKNTFLLHKVDENENEIKVAMELIKEKRLRGIIFLGGAFNHSQGDFDKLSVPFVLCTIPITKGSNLKCASVSVDDKLESYKIVDYLCKQGHKKIAIIGASDSDESIGKLRLEGYRKALKDNGLEINDRLRFIMKEDIESYSVGNGYAVMNEVLESEVAKEITAVFAIADSLAIGACRAVFDKGLRIPEDYSITGFDGIEMCNYYNPTITTIRQPVEDMAKATTKLLFDIIKDSKNMQKIVFEAELVEGNSSRIIS